MGTLLLLLPGAMRIARGVRDTGLVITRVVGEPAV